MLNRDRATTMWSIAYFILLCTLVLPINFIVISFIMVPAVILFIKLKLKAFIVHYAIIHLASYLALTMILGGWIGIFPMVISLFFLAPAIMMGNMYKKQTAAKTVLIAGILVLLGEMLLCLVVMTATGANLNEMIEQMIQVSVNDMPQLTSMVTQDQLNESIRTLTLMIPLFIILFSFYYVTITHGLVRRIANKWGGNIPGLDPMKEWKFPKSLVWCYFFALLINLFVRPDSSSSLNMVLLNLIPLLMFAFMVQAIAYLVFIADVKRWNKALPITAVLVSPFLGSIISLLGVFDIVFDIRKRFKSQQ